MAPPTTIAERYELESKIGSGGMGTVWKAHDRVLDRTVAVKLLHEGLGEDASFAARFRREAVAAASLGHSNIVTVYDTGVHTDPGGRSSGVPFIVMEYVHGESLHQLLHRTGPLPVEDTARIARSVLAGLAHAHSRGLVHRDMKPANVLFDESTGEAKVVDFGIAKGLEDTGGLTKTSGLIGTAAYLSPEQVNGLDASPASDLYAVGCLLYACLTGEPPFAGGTPVAIAMKHLHDAVTPPTLRRPDVPPAFESVLMRALEKDPARRFSSAQEMDAAIAATGLADRQSSEPVIDAAATLPATQALREHPVGAGVAHVGTEVITRDAGPRTAPWLAALTAFLVVAALGAVLVLWLQNRNTGEVITPPATLEPTPVPQTEIPQASTPPPTEGPKTDEPPRTPVIRLPGIDVGGDDDSDDDEPEPTPTPTPVPTPTPPPTLEP
jgi:eukaryotic-like serine/threonine-protein kinase